MPRKVKLLDDKIADIQNTRVWRVLERYQYDYDGNGLTANALCHLTEQSWRVVRSVLLRGGMYQVNGMYCEEVKAPVFYSTERFGNPPNMLQHGLLTKADTIIRKYPPSRYPGATRDKGQKTLTFHMFKRDRADEYDICDDPECCPQVTRKTKKKLDAEIIRESNKLSRELKRAWKR